MTSPETLMAEGEHALVSGVERLGAAWVEAAVARVVDAWGGLDAPARAATMEHARAAGDRAAARVAADLEALFALDPAQQRATPLEIIRTLRREATQVLEAAGVPPVERDRYETQSFPDDVYGVVPKSAAELGDETLGGALLAWGIGKARVLRARQNRDS
jgi:hypothetical protein